jgi:hypothetical protein
MRELKKGDLFDLGLMLTIAATDGLDMVNEDHIARLTSYKNHCCLLHGLTSIDIEAQDFD